MPTADLSSSAQNTTILDVLALEHLITPQQLEEIKVKSASFGRPYEETLTSLNIVPAELEALEFVKQKTGLNIKTFADAPDDVRKAINQQYRRKIVREVGEALK